MNTTQTPKTLLKISVAYKLFHNDQAKSFGVYTATVQGNSVKLSPDRFNNEAEQIPAPFAKQLRQIVRERALDFVKDGGKWPIVWGEENCFETTFKSI